MSFLLQLCLTPDEAGAGPSAANPEGYVSTNSRKATTSERPVGGPAQSPLCAKSGDGVSLPQALLQLG